MQINAVYDHGKLELPDNIQLKHQRFQVVVDVPDEELLPSTVSVSGKKTISEELDGILGQYRQGNKSRTALDDKAAWHKHLEEKHMK
ncbi:MAG: hypothetical protein JKY87_00010 [Mariprofundus sp.]|nr:hypothetical protein [Mariprofundus sp.]